MPTISIANGNNIAGTGDAFTILATNTLDPLIVDTTGYLIRTNASGISLQNDLQTFEVTVNGVAMGLGFDGITMATGTSGSTANLTVGAQGRVTGQRAGIWLEGTGTINNSGFISGTTDAGIVQIYTDTNLTITNSGTIFSQTQAAIQVTGNGTHTITNSGVLQGALGGIRAFGATGVENVTNSGTILGGLDLGGGADYVINTGTITGTVLLGSGDDEYDGSEGVDIVDGGADADGLFGDGGDDQLNGGAGVDYLHGGTGNDTLTGGLGSDTYVVDSQSDIIVEVAEVGAIDSVIAYASFTLATDDHIEYLQASPLFGAVNLTGNGVAQSVIGNASVNTLDGGGGDDQLTGGAGNDVFKVSTGNDTISDFRSRYFAASLSGANEAPWNVSYASGSSSVILNAAQTSVNVTLEGYVESNVTGAHIHNAPVGVNGPVVVDLNPPTGGSTVEISGENYTISIAAATAMAAGHTYVNIHSTGYTNGEIRGQLTAVTGDTGADRIDLTARNIGSFEAWQAVTADVSGSAKMTTFSNGVASSLTTTGVTKAMFTAAHFIFAGSVAQTLTGTANADDLFGAGGNDSLNGGLGADRLFGEGDNDTLNGGVDTVVDKLFGGAGNDTYVLGAATNDTVTDSAGIDTITSTISRSLLGFAAIENLTMLAGVGTLATGNALANVLTGNANANTLDGGVETTAKIDTLAGGLGNDTYIVRNAGEKIVEAVAFNLGDKVRALVTYALTSGAEVETLEFFTPTATTALNLTGNTFDQAITGNRGANTLTGLGGSDRLDGGIDAVKDILVGGTGDDLYYIRSTTDDIQELTGQGSDRLLTSVSYTLQASDSIEEMRTTDVFSTSALHLTGNDIGQLIQGNRGNNVILGLGGNDRINGDWGSDTMSGGSGSDTFVVHEFHSGQTASTMDIITDFSKGAAGVGDKISDAISMLIGGSSAPANATRARIDNLGVASFAAGSGNSLNDALLDIAASCSTGGEAEGEFALFRVGGVGAYHLFVSDGDAGLTTGDYVVQLQGITSIGSISLADENLTILT